MRCLSKNQRLTISPFTQIVIGNKNVVIYHSLFGNPNIITFPTLKLLKIFRQPHSIVEVRGNFNIEGLDEAVQVLIDGFFLNPENFDERDFLRRSMQRYKKKVRAGHLINFLSLVVSEACNFSCSYCFAGKGLVGDNLLSQRCRIMNFETAKKQLIYFLS